LEEKGGEGSGQRKRALGKDAKALLLVAPLKLAHDHLLKHSIILIIDVKIRQAPPD